MKNWICVLGVVIAAISCSSDNGAINATFEEPYRFFVYGNLDGSALNHQAGNNEYELFSSYTVNNGLLSMTSLLAQDSLQPTQAFAIKLTGQMSPNDLEGRTGSSLNEGFLALASNSGFTQVPNTYNYTFKLDSAKGHNTLNWQTNNYQVTGDSCVFGPVSSDTLANFKLELNTTGSSICVPYVAHIFETGATATAQMHLSVNNGILRAQVESFGSSISAINWFINNDPVSLQALLNINCSNQSFPLDLKADITFNNGQKETITKRLSSAAVACDINILASHRPHLKANAFNENTAEIIYYDENGTAFSSLEGDGAFSIVRAYNYQEGVSQNQSHEQLIFNGHAQLKSASGEIKEVSNLNGSFAFARPK
jgi:hypothetical protein